jgi:hypothetical protein
MVFVCSRPGQSRAHDRAANLVACVYQLPSPSHLPQQLQLLSNGGRSNYHSKGQRSMSSGKVIDIITWYLAFKRFTSEFPCGYLHYFFQSSAPPGFSLLSVGRPGRAESCFGVWCSGRVQCRIWYSSAIPDIRIKIRQCSLSVCLSVRLSVRLPARLPACLPACLSVCLSVCT